VSAVRRSRLQICLLGGAWLLVSPSGLRAELVPVLSVTNVPVRVMAANLTGNSQKYDAAGMRIFQGLRPDIVAIQEFNYAGNSAAEIRQFVTAAFGPDFFHFREAGAQIPNGIISRWPIVASGEWPDPQVSNRDFVWARLDLPGPDDLYVVSIHLHSSGGASSRRPSARARAGKACGRAWPACCCWRSSGWCSTGTSASTARASTRGSCRRTAGSSRCWRC